MFMYRLYGAVISLLFIFLASTGHSCADDRGTGIGGVAGYRGGGSGGGGGFRTYHK
ncbi:MAG: hypothetical protein H7318_03245 [Oligoflexus sp.]|nr:hypothetical protein [Oligoflexus sp.]